jgi:hypothetical protein
MSRPSRAQARGLSQRRRRTNFKFEGLLELESRQLLAPVVDTTVPVATFTPTPNQPNTQNLGTVTITNIATNQGAAPYTSVSEFTPLATFGGDIVRIRNGPGGDFGDDLYAISRGAGDNAATGAINRPGVIYRLDPATGKASVFFDLNTVISQLEPGGTAANSVSASSGLVNWYDLAFDPEGYFDGRPSMFVSSVDQNDPNKNVIYRIGPDGSFMGAFVSFTDGQGTLDFTNHPTAILVPPPEQQSFLRGLLSGGGSPSGGVGGFGGTFTALFFNANVYQPGQKLSTPALPPGVTGTSITFGPQTAFAIANNDYFSPDYATFTDFGTPSVNGFPGQPGLSGIQGLSGDLLIRDAAGNVNIDPFPVQSTIRTPIIVAPPTATTPSGVDTSSAIGTPYRRFEDAAFDSYGYFSYGTSFGPAANGTVAISTIGTPAYEGSMFVADLGTGLAVSVTPPAAGSVPIAIPVQGPGAAGIDSKGNLEFPGGNLGGRIVRIAPNGLVTPFASGFNTNGSYFSDSFVNSSLSLTFSADGTTLYVADDDAIWQFKSVADLASSTTGSLIGLNDLRTLGVPYNGQDSAVAVIDTGVDANTPNFRGRVGSGINVLTNGPGNNDLATPLNGHGTPVAGVVAQLVPQATIDPINIFSPGSATAQTLYNGLDYLSKNPFAKDPIRPNKVDRVVAVNMGFGTTATFDTEATAYRKYPQIVISLKNELKKLRSLGIAPVAAAGQLGNPIGSTTPLPVGAGDVNGMALPAILNEAISVTGVSPLPFSLSASSSPLDTTSDVYPRPLGPVLVFGPQNGVTGTGTDVLGPAGALTAGQTLFADRILSSVNRSSTTDYAAPAFDIPTWRRTLAVSAAAPVSALHNVFTEGGTSLSSAIVTGSIAMTASALSYWSNLAAGPGVTSDAYLTTPVGVHTLNFGANQLTNLSAYDNPDSINAILQWTAVPATDAGSTTDTLVTPPQLIGSANSREYSRIDIGNAIAAIEGTEAINYLLAHNVFSIIDENHNGLITAQELQDFTDKASTIGMPEAGAMARLLGGTASIGPAGVAFFGDSPDEPDVLQRRYNFFDFAGDGVLNGAISIDQYRQLSKTLLPAPDAFVVVDRQRSSLDGYLLDPRPLRDYANLVHLKPSYVWVPASAVKRFRNISPDRFKVGRGQNLSTTNPPFTLFEVPTPKAKHATKATSATGSNTGTGSTGSNTQNSSPGTTTTTSNTGSNSGSSHTGTTTTGTSNLPAQSNPVTATTTSVSGSQSNASSILAALQGLAAGHIGNPQPSGTVGPDVSSPSSTLTTPTPVTEKPTFASPPATPAGTVHQMTTNPPSPTVPQTTSSTTEGVVNPHTAAKLAAAAARKARLAAAKSNKKGRAK